MKGVTGMKITTIGLDVAKDVLQLHGVDERGHVVVSKQIKRSKVLEYFANLEQCLVGMEACGGAHDWARRLIGYGHQVKLMAPQFVKPYVKGNKNDMRDAEAICEAVTRPSMRFVPVKTAEQQALLALHRGRQGYVKTRTGFANQMRGLLAEYGIVVTKGITHLYTRIPEILEDGENGLPGMFRGLLARLLKSLKETDQQVKEMEGEIKAWHQENAASMQLATIPGIGPLTASALTATVGDARDFKSGRQLAAWLGLVPRQHSSGGKTNLLGISKRGDTYLRTLLIHGARAVIRVAPAKRKPDDWINRLIGRRNKNIAAVAVANRNARIAWALLTRKEDYKPPEIRHLPASPAAAPCPA
jgi:transposase